MALYQLLSLFLTVVTLEAVITRRASGRESVANAAHFLDVAQSRKTVFIMTVGLFTIR